MVSNTLLNAAAASKLPGSLPRSERRFKGVRKRSWGKWVSEIRVPNSRARIWLGSYTSAEDAARAFDAATLCLRGSAVPSSSFNFPDSPRVPSSALPSALFLKIAHTAARANPRIATSTGTAPHHSSGSQDRLCIDEPFAEVGISKLIMFDEIPVWNRAL